MQITDNSMIVRVNFYEQYNFVISKLSNRIVYFSENAKINADQEYYMLYHAVI